MRRLLLIAILMFSTVLFSGCTLLDSKVRAGLQVLTNNQPATLFLNGEYLDKTPFISKSIQPGVYKLRIEPEDSSLSPYELSITLRRGLLTVVTWKPGSSPETSGGVIYELEPLGNNNQNQVQLNTIPDTAIVLFDDSEQQFSPLKLENVPTGDHEFEVNLPAYESQRHTINVLGGHRLHISVKLARSSGLGEELPQPSEEPTASPSATGLPKLSPTKIADGIAKIRIKSTNYFQGGKEVIRVRDKPNTNAQTIGFLEAGTDHTHLSTSDDWHQVPYASASGWVSGEFSELIPGTAVTPSTNPSPSPTTSAAP